MPFLKKLKRPRPGHRCTLPSLRRPINYELYKYEPGTEWKCRWCKRTWTIGFESWDKNKKWQEWLLNE